jgi:aerotaxis receptor
MEIKLLEDSFLLSETDEKGIIRYVNDEFCEFSEYPIEELLGKPHNIVRHKDMPKQAFQEMWIELKKGNIWKGFVKNSTKSGKYYWVFATIFPFTSSDNEKGFVSCRRRASDDEIEKYSKIYEDMNKREKL